MWTHTWLLSCSLVFLSITTWWWQQRPLLQLQTTTSCLTASCPTPPRPLPPSCSSTNQEPCQQPLRLPRWPTGGTTRAVAAWSHPATSVTHTRAHTHTPVWWPAGAALKQQWQRFMVGYRTWYRWIDSKRVKKTLRVQLQSSNKPGHKLFGCRVKFGSRNWPQVIKLILSQVDKIASRRAVMVMSKLHTWRFPSVDWSENCSQSWLKEASCGCCVNTLTSGQRPVSMWSHVTAILVPTWHKQRGPYLSKNKSQKKKALFIKSRRGTMYREQNIFSSFTFVY